MNAIYRAMGRTKQAFHQQLNRQMQQMEEQHNLLPLIERVRLDHPRMSAREMYRLIAPQWIGRDRFEAFCFTYGFKVEVKRNFHRTTNSLGVTRFNNLIVHLELTAVDQVWVSDITYYRIGEQFFYLTFITDLYSRFIVGFAVSPTLLTEHTTLVALTQAIKQRNPKPGLILHSDGGGQYYSKELLSVTAQWGIRNSMCDSVYENAHAERINGIIKNQYLQGYAPQDLNQLKQMTGKAVDRYNHAKPHQALAGLTPAAFEKKRKGI